MATITNEASLNFHSLYTVLTHGMSSDKGQLQDASNQLQIWQKEPGFYALLQMIIGDLSLALDVRWLAAIQMKNGIDRFWRRTASSAISGDEKNTIRSRCIQLGINEPDHRLALQNALFVAKIIRIDGSHDWPDAFPTLLRALERSTDPSAPHLHLPRALLLLLTTVKELSAARMPITRKLLKESAPSILLTLHTIYTRLVDSWQAFFQGGSSDEARATADMERSLMCLRILRRLIVSGFETPSRDEQIQSLWVALNQHFFSMMSMMRQHGDEMAREIRGLFEKHVLQTSKLHLSMIDDHPSAYPQLPGAISIAKAYWDILAELGQTFVAQTEAMNTSRVGLDEDIAEIPFLEKLGLRGLLFLRSCVKMVYDPRLTIKYQTAEDKRERSDSKSALKDWLLSDTLVRDMMEILVARFLVLRPSDLRKWHEAPDEWERQEESEGDNWKYSIRVCAEKLFLDLVLNHKELLIQPLLNVFHTVARIENRDVLLKDSIYGAIGLAAPILTGRLDFNAFMGLIIIPELQIRQSDYNILRRRAAIILGQWVSTGGIENGLVYQIFQFLLDKSDPLNDLVVRMTAGRQLKNAIDPYTDARSQLHPYFPNLIDCVLGLTSEVDLVETKIALLGTLEALVQAMAEDISLYADRIMLQLSRLWDQAGSELLFKQNILGLLNELLKAMRAGSANYHSLVLPLISSALDPGNQDRLNLIDDAVELWSTVLTEAPGTSTALEGLFLSLPPLFAIGDENIRKLLEIASGYVLLSPGITFSEPAIEIWRTLAVLIAQPLNREIRIAVCDVVELTLIAAQRLGGEQAVQSIIQSMENSALLSCFFNGLIDAFKAHQDPSPRSPKTDIDGKVETSYWAVISRLVIGYPRAFIILLDKWSSKSGPADIAQALMDLLTELFSHYESLATAERSKLIALALTTLFSSQEAQLLQRLGSRLQEFIALWTAAIHECFYGDKDNLIWGDVEALRPSKGIDESAEDERRRELEFADPVRRVDIRDAVRDAVRSFSRQLGEQAFEDCASNVDKDVLAQFQALELFG